MIDYIYIIYKTLQCRQIYVSIVARSVSKKSGWLWLTSTTGDFKKCVSCIHPGMIKMLGVSKRQELTSSRLHANRFFFTAQAESVGRSEMLGAESDIQPKPDPQRIKWKWFRFVYSGLYDFMCIYKYMVYSGLYDFMCIYIYIIVVYLIWCVYIYNYMVYSGLFDFMCIYIL
jgi:hypothetical protein